MLLCSIYDHCGFYIGTDGFMVITPEFSTIMLRLFNGHIVSALFTDHQVTGVVDGYEQQGAALLQAKGKARSVRPSEMLEELNALTANFALCIVQFSDHRADVAFDGQEFTLALAAEIDLNALRQPLPVDRSLPVAERMRQWNHGLFFGWDGDKAVRAWVGNDRYDMNWGLDMNSGFIYCRLGVNGYCGKGWAMRSTAVLRAHEVRMLTDHRDALLPYHPNEEYFVADGCAFPDDGGWYWSVREATDDVITLNGCGGDTYCIYRTR